jgi:phosphatidylserine synthase
MVVLSLVFYYGQYSVGDPAKVVLPVVLATSILMVSPIRYPKPPRLSFHKGWGNTLFIVGCLGLVVSLFVWGGWVLLPGVALYVVGGLVRWLMRYDSASNLRSIEREG